MESHKLCALCGTRSDLQDSHILPAFAFKWLKRYSATGHIRSSDQPNRRAQDGPKEKLLCAECENRFSKDESIFASKLFRSWLGGDRVIAYDEWLLRFCTSISWRVLKFCKGKNPNARYTDEQQRLTQEADVAWREVLIRKTPHAGKFEQHLLIHEIIEDTNFDHLPYNINRFLMGGITMDIVGSDRSLMTFAKLGRFMLFGIIQKGPNRWDGTKVHVKNGVIRPGKFEVPPGLAYLFEEKATLLSGWDKNLSPNQRAQIDAEIRKLGDKFALSEQFPAMEADARLFGLNAITRKW